MLGLRLASARLTARITPRRAARPTPEHLEGRLLLYSTLGDQWTYDSRITYSFMPDGTSVGGTPSALFQTLNNVASTATWEAQIEQAASLWENAANVNLALVPDGGEPVGTSGDQQDDPRFGDIRIGAIPLASGVLAETFLPPPANGGTDAGDILLNSTATWAVNNTYDLMTVAAHEFGHALGLGESSVVSAVMYGTYNGIKQTLTSDDVSGIDSIYGAPHYDQFNNSGTHNGSFLTAANITPDINSQSQIALAGLDITVPGQAEWFSVTVPSATTGQMTVTVQSSNLSSLEPGLMVYNSNVQLVSQTYSQSPGGATVSTTIAVQAGQKYYIKGVSGGTGAAGTVGAYGLLVNFGSQTQSPIPPPNTVVSDQPDEGGGTISNALLSVTNSGGGTGQPGNLLGSEWTTIGDLSGWVVQMNNASGGGNLSLAIAQPSQSASSEGGSIGALPSFSTTTAMGPQSDSNTGQQAELGRRTPAGRGGRLPGGGRRPGGLARPSPAVFDPPKTSPLTGHHRSRGHPDEPA